MEIKFGKCWFFFFFHFPGCDSRSSEEAIWQEPYLHLHGRHSPGCEPLLSPHHLQWWGKNTTYSVVPLSGATNAKLLFLNIRQRNHGDSIASTSPWTQRIPQSVLRLICLGAQESLLLKLAMLSLSLRNADNIKLSSETFLVFNIRVFLIGLQCWPGQWPNSISWPLSCPVLLAQCVFATLVPVSWCHNVFFLTMIAWSK